MPIPRRLVGLALLCVGLAATPARPQGLEYIQSHYTKYEYKVPMRDGVRLFTAVYVPKDDRERYPILLTRTPYSVQPYGPDRFKSDLGPSAHFGREGYIVVYQDVRGRWMSEGEFRDMRPYQPHKDGSHDIDETSDTYDTIDWLIKHVPNHNGKVGMWGISYPGFYTDCGIIDAHPALKAASPQAPVTDWFTGDDWHHNGALFLPHAFNFLAMQGRPRPGPTRSFGQRFEPGTPDGYQFFLNLGPLRNANTKHFKDEVTFWNEMMRHGTYDEFWKARNLRPYLKQIKPAVLTVGGWYDAENLFGALETFKAIESSGPSAQNTIVMGPWLHGGWSGGTGESLGHVHFRSNTAEYFRENIEFPFFQDHLKGKGSSPRPQAWLFETGTDRWRTFDVWPPREARSRSLHLRSGGRLTFDPPTEESAGSSFDEYVSDPSRPVPYLSTVSFGMAGDYMVADQRFAAQRPDVLVYTGEVLEDDITAVGPLEADLYVSTSGTDSDWVVKLIDVYPDDYPDPTPNPAGVHMGAYQQLVRGDVMRGKFRNSLEKPEPFEPGQPTRVRFRLNDVDHSFRSGHRIMVQIQSTWFPLVDRNPQSFVDIYNARETDFQKATQRVYHSRERSSHLTVRVLP